MYLSCNTTYVVLFTATPDELFAKYYALVSPSPPLTFVSIVQQQPLVSIVQQQQGQPPIPLLRSLEIDTWRGDVSNGPLCISRLRHEGFTLAKLRLVKIFEYEVCVLGWSCTYLYLEVFVEMWHRKFILQNTVFKFTRVL